jgi:hypothetical protein
MNITKIVLLAFSLFFSSFSGFLNAQSKAVFDEQLYNFGTIEENKGAVSHEFEFLNTGKTALFIDTIIANCSCIQLNYSKKGIEPGKYDKVKVLLEPASRNGNFQNSIEVKFKGQKELAVLRVVANVVPGISNPVKYYGTKIGKTRFKSNYLNFGNVNNDTVLVKVFDVYNDSDSSITFLEQIGHAPYFKVKIDPMVLRSKEIGKITIELNAKEIEKLGPRSDFLTISTDENTRDALKYLFISSDIKYSFGDMSEEDRENSAYIKFERSEHNFGNILMGEIVETKFKFTNTGKKDLKIVQTSVSCGCTAGLADKEIYKPGESGFINVSFDSKGRQGSQNKYISVFTDSPIIPKTELRISANVKTNIPEAE